MSNNELTVNQVCERFYVTPQTVYRWKKEGAPIDRVGRRLVCKDFQALKKWWEDRYANGTDYIM